MGAVGVLGNTEMHKLFVRRIGLYLVEIQRYHNSNPLGLLNLNCIFDSISTRYIPLTLSALLEMSTYQDASLALSVSIPYPQCCPIMYIRSDSIALDPQTMHLHSTHPSCSSRPAILRQKSSPHTVKEELVHQTSRFFRFRTLLSVMSFLSRSYG